MHDESLYAERALRAGALGYVMKQERGKKVREAISRVLGGDCPQCGCRCAELVKGVDPETIKAKSRYTPNKTQSANSAPKVMPTPRARASPKLSNATDKPPTGFDANILKACAASLDAALTLSAATVAGLGAATDALQLEQALALSGIWVPHF